MFIPTLNKMGFMSTDLDPCSQAFVDFAGGCTAPVLEIGAAFGVATLAALNAGATIIANDIEVKHLDHIKTNCPPEFQQHLQLLPGSFPAEIERAENSLGAILISRVLHFFDGATVEQSLAQCFSWLQPGGKLFVITETPYLKNWQEFIPVFEQRLAANEQWPGVADPFLYNCGFADQLPELVHWFNPEVLSRAAINAGFVVEQCDYIARPDFPEVMRFDGRESVALIAVK